MVTREPLGNLEPLYGNVRRTATKGFSKFLILEWGERGGEEGGLNLGNPRDIDKQTKFDLTRN